MENIFEKFFTRMTENRQRQFFQQRQPLSLIHIYQRFEDAKNLTQDIDKKVDWLNARLQELPDYIAIDVYKRQPLSETGI